MDEDAVKDLATDKAVMQMVMPHACSCSYGLRTRCSQRQCQRPWLFLLRGMKLRSMSS
jgi:hypothetical protein